MFVGGIIMGAREAFPDLPTQTLSIPPVPVYGAGATVVGSLLDPTIVYKVKATFLLPWGETLSSPEMSTVAPIGGNQFTMTINGIPPGATGIKIYYGIAANAENAWVIFPVTSTTGSQVVTLTGINAVSGGVPSRNSAYLPDSDGKAISAYRVFDWLSDGLRLAGQIVGGGIPDMSGFNCVVGQPWYELLGNWKKIDGAWYQGYPVFFGRKTDVFRKNNVTGISAALVVDYYADTVRVEMWPQPSTAGGRTTNSVAVAITDAVVNCAALASFTLGFGFAQIGTEVISYAGISGNQLTGVIRGWGGTNAQTWPVGTQVLQFNGNISGLRIPSSYTVGDSGKTLRLPPGWEDPIQKYLIHRFRLAEQKGAEAKELLQMFTAGMQQLRTNKQYAGPIQIQASAGRGAEVYPGLGGPFGGVIVP